MKKACPTFKQFINEAIIDWQGNGLENFIDELESMRRPMIPQDFKRWAAQYSVEVVPYSTFIRELPDEHKDSAPDPRTHLFALLNPVTERPRVVVNVPMLGHREFKYIAHMIKHELIHMGQSARRPYGMGAGGFDPNDKTAYFSNKDEVMAFSHSVADQLLQQGAGDMEEAMAMLPGLRLWKDIKANATPQALARYRKYIYQYLKLELDNQV